jgi:hypothetical protein
VSRFFCSVFFPPAFLVCGVGRAFSACFIRTARMDSVSARGWCGDARPPRCFSRSRVESESGEVQRGRNRVEWGNIVRRDSSGHLRRQRPAPIVVVVVLARLETQAPVWGCDVVRWWVVRKVRRGRWNVVLRR